MGTLSIETALLKTFNLLENNPVQFLFNGLSVLTFIVIAGFVGFILFFCFESIMAKIVLPPCLALAIAMFFTFGINEMMSPLSGLISYNLPYTGVHALNPELKLKPRYDEVMECMKHSCILDASLLKVLRLHIEDNNDSDRTIKTVKGQRIRLGDFAIDKSFTLVSVEASNYEDTVHGILVYHQYRMPYMAFIKLSDGDVARMPLSFIAAAAVPYDKAKSTSKNLDTELSSHFQNSVGNKKNGEGQSPSPKG